METKKLKPEIKKIKVDLAYLTIEDYEDLKSAMIKAYETMPDAYWREHQIQTMLNIFPEGQVVIKVNGQIAGCALSIIIDFNKFGDDHTYNDVTGHNTFHTHTRDGDTLYGIDVFVKPEFRGLRLGRRLYDYRK